MQIVSYTETRLVKRHRGTMPIILTCPHDGDEVPPNVPDRTQAATPADCDFKTGRDRQTAAITEAVAQKILDVTGLSPYVVIARFRRLSIDANRRPACAFTDPAAATFYDEYHNRIAEYVTQLRSENENRGFLFDIHGTNELPQDPADIYLGTANGRSLVPGFNRANIFMQHGLRGLLNNSWSQRQTGEGALFWYRVSPTDATTAETGVVNGGFTVRNYSTSLNCIQIEIANTIRNDAEKRNFLSEDLAFALINSVRRYAPF